jgi:hypothetical protein
MSRITQRSNGARRNRVKGRTTATVSSVSSITHLDSSSDLHAEHQELSKRLHSEARSQVTVQMPAPQAAKFPSLGKGILFNGEGEPIDSDSHLQLLSQLTRERGNYIATETRKNGATYKRKLPTTGIRQLAVTYFPIHSMTLARLDNMGIPVRDVVMDHTRRLGVEFGRLTGYETVAMQIHPNEGNLHQHICYATVDAENQLINPLGGRGRRGLRFLGPSCIGTLRLVEHGLWPEADAGLARKFLAGSVRGGVEPVDWVLARYLDGLAERSLLEMSHFNPAVKDIWEGVVKEYASYATARREARPDLMAERIETLSAENAALRDELAALKQSAALKGETLVPELDPLGLPVLNLGSSVTASKQRNPIGRIGIDL